MSSFKFLRRTCVILVICLLSGDAFSQISIGVQGTAGAFSWGVGGLRGFGVEAGYGLLPSRRNSDNGSKLFPCASFNYYGGGSGSTTYTGNAYSSVTSPQYIEVPVSWTHKLLQFNVGAKYYVAGGMAAKFSFYPQLGLSFVAIPVKYKVGAYDQANYDIGGVPQNEVYAGLAIHAGVGLDVKAGPVHIYFATRLQVPFNQVNGEDIDVVVPFGAMADLGLRVPIGEK